MNTGLLLKKPGESPYARFRRFLIANHGSHKNSVSIRARLLDTIINFSGIKPISRNILTSDIAYRYECLKSTSFTADSLKQTIPKYFRPRQHCQKCTEMGYHSNLFELPWVKQCPVHKIPLTKRCGECGRALPSSSDLLSTKCSSCGSRINIREILQKNRFLSTEDFKIFDDISALLNVDSNIYPSFTLLDQSKAETGRQRVNINSSFYPSVIHEISSNQHAVSRGFDSGIFYKYQLSKKVYQFNKDTPLSIDYYSATFLEEKVKHKVATRISDYLDKKTANKNAICKAYQLWKALVSYKTDDIDAFELDNIMYGHYLQDYTQIHVPKSLYYIDGYQSVNEENRLPKALTKKIYQIDLWFLFLQIVYSLKYINTDENKPIQFTTPLPCPLYIKKVGNSLELKYPKIVDQNYLESPLLDLLFM